MIVHNVMVFFFGKFVDVPTNIVNLTFSDVQSTSLNISWSIEGENAAAYEISVYMNDELVVDYNTTNLNYSITDLEPCGNYMIGVSPVPSNENNTQFVNVTTSSDGVCRYESYFIHKHFRGV